MRRHGTWTLPLLLTIVLLAATSLAMGADIASYDQALDRLRAQALGARSDVAEVLGDPASRPGPLEVTTGNQALRLGHGPGWLFAARLDIGKNPLFLVAFVGEDASVDMAFAKDAPQGLSPIPTRTQATDRTATAVTSRDQAYAVLLADLLGHSAKGRRIHAATAKVEQAQVAVPTWKGQITLGGGPGWLFFVDDAPSANWAHACRYVLVSEDGALHVQAAQTPPNDMSAFTELTAGSTARTTPAGGPAPQAAGAQSTPAANRYAVIISGGWNKYSNYPRYWNDCAFFYNTLMQYGFLKDHVTVLFADGTDPAVDRPDGLSSPLDFDGDSLPDINYSATKANIALVFNQLAATLGPNDILYLFTTDHGSAQESNLYPYYLPMVNLVLWGEEITGEDLAVEVNKVTPKAMVGIFEQCFSGGLVETLAGTNRVVMSASRWWELSYAMGPDYLYDEFSYYVTSALADPKQGDTNGDGIVTMEEAYLYALGHDSNQSESLDSSLDNLGEHPSYLSTPWDLGRTLSLGGSVPTARPPVLAGYTQTQTTEAFPAPETSAAKNWHGDDATWTLALPFAFPLAGSAYASVAVSSNGILFFGTPSTSGKNSIGGLTASLAIAPQWDDLTTADSQSDIFVTSTADHVTIVWMGATYVDSQWVNMAVRLYPSGTFTLYYDSGNNLTGRLPLRDKTIGLGTGTALHPALHNGLPTLGYAQALTFRKAAYPWAVAPNFLLLSE